MAQPTPWGRSETPPGRPDPPPAPDRPKSAAYRRPDLGPYLALVRANWGYLSAAVAGFVSLILLFQPWLTASGPDGRAATNAFGRIDATTAYLSAWSQQHNGVARITGIWAILAAAAIVVTCVMAVLNVRLRTEIAARATAISAMTAAAFIILTLVYINSKAPELKAMTARQYDAGGQIGSLMAWAFGNGSLAIPGIARKPYSSAGLTPWGLVAGGLSLFAAAMASTQWLRDHPASRPRLRLRSPIVAATAAPAQATSAAAEPVTSTQPASPAPEPPAPAQPPATEPVATEQPASAAERSEKPSPPTE
ncbi:hypothetical protein [Nocardia blacklockiae]|uniref:hypothetical protein n=1 Tax=Nocardia blacklockiae TaxID=480036 RepID=UPI0018955124|nr:hypothetical protein [Nocardia blacklockiae]MBF6172115.1 hypothetical protein [Nocardia blacklockiae]